MKAPYIKSKRSATKSPKLKPNKNRRSSPGSKKRRFKKAPKDPTQGLPPINLHAAAIDIGASEHWVAIPPEGGKSRVGRYGCTTADLKELVQWLKDNQVDTVVMEATGNYWVVLYDMLEKEGLHPVVVNPRYAKNMSGRKGDIPDCEWMQKLHTFGLFTNSFRPQEAFRILRSYQRQRESLVQDGARAIQHMQKALTEMNVQLAHVISDISGQTGLEIIDAILAGERDPHVLARLKNPRIKASPAQIARSLEGHWKPEQLFILEQARLTYMHYQEQLIQTEDKIQQQLQTIESRLADQPEGKTTPPKNSKARSKHKPSLSDGDLSQQIQRVAGVDVSRIDGMGPILALTVISEVGVDMSPWATEKRFSSWLGLCPDHRISGGKILGRNTRPVVSRARNAFRMAAYSLERSQTWLGAKYRRLKRRLGAPKAITAMAHHLARLFYVLLKHGQEYVDKGVKAYEEKYRAQRLHWLQKQAKALNLKLVPDEQLAA